MAVNVTAKSRTITNGTANDGSVIEANMTELYNNDSALATGVNAVIGTDSVTGKIDGKFLVVRNSFSGTPASGDHAGLEIERGSSTNVAVRWNETNDEFQLTNNGTNYSRIIRKRYAEGCVVSYASASTVTVGIGEWTDSTGKHVIEVTSPLTLNITASGANGLDTGAEANNTWYYVYLIMKSSDGTVAGLLSTVNESVTGSVTLPSGYDIKRQLRIAVRNDSSSNLIAYSIAGGWPNAPRIRYQVSTGPVTGTVGPTNVLDGGSATSFGALSLASFVPPISQYALLKVGVFDSGSNTFFLRTTGQSHNGDIFLVNSTTQFHDYLWELATNSSQQVDWKWNTNTGTQAADIHVMGYIVTEVQ